MKQSHPAYVFGAFLVLVVFIILAVVILRKDTPNTEPTYTIQKEPKAVPYTPLPNNPREGQDKG